MRKPLTLRSVAYLCDWHDKAINEVDMIRERGVICTLRVDMRSLKAIAVFDWQVSLGDESAPTHEAICRRVRTCRPDSEKFMFVRARGSSGWYRVLAVRDNDDGRTMTVVLSKQAESYGDRPSEKYGGKYGRN